MIVKTRPLNDRPSITRHPPGCISFTSWGAAAFLRFRVVSTSSYGSIKRYDGETFDFEARGGRELEPRKREV